jgi:hypothetical protein
LKIVTGMSTMRPSSARDQIAGSVTAPVLIAYSSLGESIVPSGPRLKKFSANASARINN